MPVQFTGKLNANQYQIWTTYGWNRDLLLQWSVRPKPGQVGNVALRALAIEAVRDGTLTYWLTVWNIGQRSVEFEALYSAVTTAQTIIDAPGPYSLGAGKTVYGTWDFGVAPTLVNIIALPQNLGVRSKGILMRVVLECSMPSVQLNADGTATYSFSVTNSGTSTASYSMRASLT